MERKINIIALNIPYPPNYGGVIDIYYKIEALHRQGIGVILHCFEYDRPQAPQLENICLEVHYYKRKTGLLPNLSTLPYNVYGRKDPLLLENLQKNDYPILFDGLHSCYYLNHPSLRNRFKIFRECNIEHDYYRKLALSEHSLIRKSFLLLESLRFAAFQKKVKAAQLMLCVSQADTSYLQKKFPENRVVFVPCFHANREVSATPGQSDFILYHGKLSVAENEKAALYLIRNVFSKLPYRCVIAGMKPSKRLSRAAQKHANIILEADPERERMDFLIRQAQLNLLLTFQATGLKLKLLNSLFSGRHVVVNPAMVNGSGLDCLCHIARNPQEIISLCHRCMQTPFGQEEIQKRKQFLFPFYDNDEQAKKMVEMIFRD